MIKIKTEEINTGSSRILAVSDIHGHDHILKELLKKAEFSQEDQLIIIGDIIEKGPYSLKTLRYIMELEKQSNVHVTLGNVDCWQFELIGISSPQYDERLFQYIQMAEKRWGGTLFLDFCKELGLKTDTVTQVTEAKKIVQEKCKAELDFLEKRPSILKTGNYIFVHGGLPENWQQLEGQDVTSVLKYDDFLNRDNRFQQYVVVGHWPVCLYLHDKTAFNPIIDEQQHVISIDGGCGLKRDGQLNCLVIPNSRAEGKEIHWVSYDPFPLVTALDHQQEKTASVYIQYTDNTVELMEEQQEVPGLCNIRHKSTGRCLTVPEGYLYTRNDRLCCDDFTDYLMEVKAGEQVALVERNSLGYLIKKDGISSWYQGRIAEDVYRRGSGNIF